MVCGEKSMESPSQDMYLQAESQALTMPIRHFQLVDINLSKCTSENKNPFCLDERSCCLGWERVLSQALSLPITDYITFSKQKYCFGVGFAELMDLEGFSNPNDSLILCAMIMDHPKWLVKRCGMCCPAVLYLTPSSY